jgi:hypothetical protein
MLFDDLAYLRPKLGIEDSVAGLGLANFTERNLGSEGAHEGESYHGQVHDWNVKNGRMVGFVLPGCTLPSANYRSQGVGDKHTHAAVSPLRMES